MEVIHSIMPKTYLPDTHCPGFKPLSLHQYTTLSPRPSIHPCDLARSGSELFLAGRRHLSFVSSLIFRSKQRWHLVLLNPAEQSLLRLLLQQSMAASIQCTCCISIVNLLPRHYPERHPPVLIRHPIATNALPPSPPAYFSRAGERVRFAAILRYFAWQQRPISKRQQHLRRRIF